MATGELAASGSVSAQAQTRPSMAYAALIAGVLCISFTAIFTKLAHVPGPVAAAYRMTIATAVLTLPLAWHHPPRGQAAHRCAVGRHRRALVCP